jgi:hypothetical protein
MAMWRSGLPLGRRSDRHDVRPLIEQLRQFDSPPHGATQPSPGSPVDTHPRPGCAPTLSYPAGRTWRG